MNKVYQGKPVAVYRKICGWQQVLFFLHEKSKNQGSGLLGTVGGGFWLWKPHRERWILGQFFWSFCELAQTGDSDIFYVRQPYDDGQPK